MLYQADDSLVSLLQKIKQIKALIPSLPNDAEISLEDLQKLESNVSELLESFDYCFSCRNSLSDLAKFTAFLYKSKCCLESQRLSFLQQAQQQAQYIVSDTDSEFSSGLYLGDIGNGFYNLGRYEEAILSYDKAIEFKPDDHEAWNNRGNALGNLGRNEEALKSYQQALTINQNRHRL